MNIEDVYKNMYMVRCFENRLLELFSEGLLSGTTHTYSGQEANAASVIMNLNKNDIVFSNHRCHGHYLIKEDDPEGLLAEIMGRDIGACRGRGGSQHLHRNRFYSNGIQGGFLPNALGMAFSEKYRETNNIVVAFIGDGTMGEGAVYETLNLASLWKVPLLIVIENNYYAQTTSIEQNLAGSIIDRVKAFDISVNEITSNDVAKLYPMFLSIINNVREQQSPHVQIVNTYRLNAHSKGDDFRHSAEINSWKERDPLIYAGNMLKKERRKSIENTVVTRLSEVEEKVKLSSFAKINNED